MSRRRAGPPPWVLPVVTVLAIASIVFILRSNSPTESGEAANTDAAPAPPADGSVAAAASGAFAAGGKPRPLSAPERRLFEDAIPHYVIALNQWRDGTSSEEQLDRATARLHSEATALWEDGAVTALDHLLRTAYAAAAARGEAIDSAAESLAKATNRFNAEMAALDVGAYIDSDVLTQGNSTVVLLFSFAVERVRIYRVGDHTTKALVVRRLDDLNWSYSLLGVSSPLRSDTLILANQIEARLLNHVIPAVRTGGRALWAFDSEPAAIAPALDTLVRSAAERELGQLTSGANIAELAALLAERRRIYSGINRRLKERGVELPLPSRLEVEEELRVEVDRVATESEKKALARVRTAVAEPAVAGAFDDITEAWLRSVEVHEIQHSRDVARGLTTPTSLSQRTGPVRTRPRPGGLAYLARAESSAYLAELARDEELQKLSLALLVGYLLDERAWWTAECYAAVAIVEVLEEELGRPRPELVRGREIDRDAAVAVSRRLLEAPEAELRQAAARGWKRLFGESLAKVELIAPREP